MNELPKVEAGSFLVVRADGSEAVVRTKPTLPALREAIGAETLEFVRIGKLDGTDLVMAIDDRGYDSEMVEVAPGHFKLNPVKANKPPNAKASNFYWWICRPGTTHQIVGDVALFHDDDFGGGAQ